MQETTTEVGEVVQFRLDIRRLLQMRLRDLDSLNAPGFAYPHERIAGLQFGRLIDAEHTQNIFGRRADREHDIDRGERRRIEMIGMHRDQKCIA